MPNSIGQEFVWSALRNSKKKLKGDNMDWFRIANSSNDNIVLCKYWSDFLYCLEALQKNYPDEEFITKAVCPKCGVEVVIDTDNESWSCDECGNVFDNEGNSH